MNYNLGYRNNIDNSKNLFNLKKCIELLEKKDQLKYIGEGINGTVFIASSPQCGSIVLKSHKNKKDNYMFKREILFTELTKEVVLNNNCPNFIYTYMVIKDYIIMEFADGDLNKLLDNNNFEKKFLDNFNFQILIGILVMQKILFMVHNDLQLQNIFYKNISSDKIKYFEYNINGEKFYLENLGYLIIIADFGNSQSILLNPQQNWFDYKTIVQMIKSNHDFNNLKSLFYKCLSRKIIKIISSLKILSTLVDMEKPDIKKIYNDYNIKYNGNEEIILIKMIIYIFYHNIIDYKPYISNLNYYMVSDDFKKFISIIYDSDEDINLIIEKNFSQYKNINVSKLESNQIKKITINYEIF